MAFYFNTFEGGTDGTTMTTGNLGGISGDAPDTVVGTLAFESDQAMHGSLSAVYGAGGADSTSSELRWLGLDTASIAMRGYFRYTSVSPAASVYLFQVRNSSEAAIANVVLRTNGTLCARNRFVEIGASVSGTLSINTWYRVEAIFTVAGGGNDRIQYALYAGDATSATYSYDSGAALTFTEAGNIDRAYIGKGASVSLTGPNYIDSIALDTSPSGYIGPYDPVPSKITGLAVTKVSSTSTQVAWTNVGDATNGYSVVRCPGTQVNDDQGRTPADAAYDPRGLTGAVTLIDGHSGTPYIDAGVAAGTYTYWVVRTAP